MGKHDSGWLGDPWLLGSTRLLRHLLLLCFTVITPSPIPLPGVSSLMIALTHTFGPSGRTSVQESSWYARVHQYTYLHGPRSSSVPWFTVCVRACVCVCSLLQVICILSRSTKDRYDAIKKLCCLEKPGEAD